MPDTLQAQPIEPQEPAFNIHIGKCMAIKALIDSGIPVREIAEEMQVSPNTVTRVRRKFDSNQRVVESLKKSLPAAFYTMSSVALANISPRKLQDSSALQLATVSGICVDKARSMEGLNQPVFNLVELSLSVTKAIAESTQRLEAIDTALASLPQS